jgi:hypothetical protein
MKYHKTLNYHGSGTYILKIKHEVKFNTVGMYVRFMQGGSSHSRK